MNPITIEPIGQFLSPSLASYELPRQPSEQYGISGKIVLNPRQNFEQALEGLEGFERIWVLFVFDRSPSWRPKILSPRSKQKMGLFATRSPHRPSRMGMSCVKLDKIEKRTLFISSCDMHHQTPIIDIKPYIPLYDSYPSSHCGWLDENPAMFEVAVSALAQSQIDYLHNEGVVFSKQIFRSLAHFSAPNHYNRIKKMENTVFCMAYKTWRLHFELIQQEKKITVFSISSGFLRFADMDLVHKKFVAEFYPSFLAINSGP